MDVARGDAAGPGASTAPAPADAPVSAPGVVGARVAARRSAAAEQHRPWWREMPALVGLALVLTLLVRTLLVQAFYIPSGSMEPTMQVGDRVLVSKAAYRVGDVRRGDVIVFDGTGSFNGAAEAEPSHGLLARGARAVGAFLGVAPSEKDFTKRVIGLPGDRVVCCDATGRVTVNGRALDEGYLMAGDAPSTTAFDVVVPPGRLWVMGDHRSDSADSRAHLGDPGGGTVPVDRVVGKVVGRFWPLGRAGGIAGPDAGGTP